MTRLKAAILVGALALAPGALVSANTVNWSVTVKDTGNGHLIGNPEAPDKLTEYISYTCSHCATFAKEGDPVLKLAFVGSGKYSLEIRHLLRDPIDLTAAMLTHCGDASKFPLNHSAIMLSQSKWLPLASKASQAQIQRWTLPDQAAARRNIANDFGFYDMMKQRGYRITDLDMCLNNNAKALEMAKTSRDDAQRLGLTGTPSFVLNGELLDHAHNWASLEQALNAAAKAKSDQ
ncbi:MAG: thioredoxin domain-containing protein [Erythrobacter sp.]